MVTSLQIAHMLDLPERSVQAVVYQVLTRRDSFGTFPTVRVPIDDGIDMYLATFTHMQVADIIEYLEPTFGKVLLLEMERTNLPVLTREHTRQTIAKHLCTLSQYGQSNS